ncbi:MULTISPECIES: asparagine synthase-related protein [unclassified Carboxylicivirga]|uniref:asparagine synthase-related protein n=1 Tax=Carboxylicivirga TaxID=1628153 RepID=UPI003D3379EF
MKIDLVNKSWIKFETSEFSIFFIGYIEFRSTLFLKASELAVLFAQIKEKEVELVSFILDTFLPNGNGNFALILKNKSQYLIACDYTRNYPLYIINDASNLIVTDHIGQLIFKKEHDKLAQEEFLLAGLVTGNRTVYKNVKGIQAGEMAIVLDGNIIFKRYFVLKSDPLRKKSALHFEHVYDQIDNLLIKTFKRMLKSCPNVKNWIVPLSGGLDSRLIISYLYRLGCKNVICFTYGIRSSQEVAYSKQAAEAFSFKWYFVEYSEKEWEVLHRNGLFDKYVRYAFNGCCLPHSQDFLALKKLIDEGVICKNDVVVPGHTAFTEAANINIKNISTQAEALKFVFNKYYTLFPSIKSYPKFVSTLAGLFDEGEQSNKSFPEFFNWQERQSKFIINSVRAYEFFGLNWRIPFWEKEVIDFWHELDFDDRIEREIMYHVANKRLFHNNIQELPVINKYKKVVPPKSKMADMVPQLLKSYIVSVLKRKVVIGEGTNSIFALKANSVGAILYPMKLYPLHIKRYLSPVLIRKPYQMNVNALMAIYTLKEEVFIEEVPQING